MALAKSKVTSQGQISIPAEILKRLEIGPRSILEWEEDGNKIILRHAGKYTSQDIHETLFPDGPPPYRTDEELKAGIGEYIRAQRTRRRY